MLTNKQEREYKWLKIVNPILLCVVAIYLVMDWSDILYYSAPEIDYSKLNNIEKIYAESIINDIKPEYLNTSRRITFTTNIYDVQPSLFRQLTFRGNKEGYYTIGTNRKIFKNIKLFLSGNPIEDRENLCHEILHSILNNVMDEYFVKDMAQKGVCFKNG